MLLFQTTLIGLTLITLSSASDEESAFYWREYTGLVPPDAFPSGKDLDGHDTYIGQGYWNGYGLFPAQIFQDGVLSVDMPVYGVRTANVNVKILCTKFPETLTWMTTSLKTFEDDIRNLGKDGDGSHPVAVIGGYDEAGAVDGRLNVGRVAYQGVTIVGNIATFRKGNSNLYFPFRKIERSTTLYQVLVYRRLVDYDVDPKGLGYDSCGVKSGNCMG